MIMILNFHMGFTPGKGSLCAENGAQKFFICDFRVVNENTTFEHIYF